MEFLLFFLIAFVLVNLFYNIFVIRKDNALKKMKTSKEVVLFCKLNKLDVNKLDLKSLVKTLSCTNSFIISLMGTFVLALNKYISNFYLWLILSAIVVIIILIPVIILAYKFIGKKIKKECR